MRCVTGKNSYVSEEIAKEALIQNRIKHSHRDGSGPLNIYQCPDCEEWHLTSSGEIADFLLDQEVVNRIDREKRFLDWSDKL